MDEGAAGPASIRLVDVSKTFVLGSRRISALSHLDLEIEGPGFFAVMGASGSGKSTLLHLLAGLDRPDSGQIEIAGQRVDQLSESALTVFRRHRVGIVFQQFNLISTLSALENVALPAMLDGMPRAERRDQAMALLELLGLSARGTHRPDALSGGEQQRVAIARALMFEPKVLLADEPTGNLDTTTSKQIWQLLSRLADERTITVLMVTHEPAAAVHCRRIFVLSDGRTVNAFDVEGMNAAELATRAQCPGG